VTPDIFAQENGKDGMAAEELKGWLANNDRYLREREGDLGSVDGTETPKTRLRLENTVRE
jgi:hypothetical protein